jgi:hypothetical protein
MSTNVTDPAEAAANDVQAALHLPGPVSGWPRRYPVRLPASLEDRVAWLQSYADWLRQEAGTARRTC